MTPPDLFEEVASILGIRRKRRAPALRELGGSVRKVRGPLKLR
jgi:hypothetical protein